MQNDEFEFSNSFRKFFKEYLNKVEDESGLTIEKIALESKVSRTLIYRWMQKRISPKPETLFRIFYTTLKIINPKWKEAKLYNETRVLMSEAYQCLLIDFYEWKEYTFC